MRRIICLFLFLCFFASAGLAATKEAATEIFKDVPPKHWAAGAIYNLKNLKVISGLPDQTFRGDRNVSRYETAAFLSKLSDVLGGSNVKDIKSDLTQIKNELAALRKSSQIPVSGSIETVLRYGNLFSNDIGGHGPVNNYRVMASIMNELGEGTSVKFNIDTMDAGFYGGSRDLATQFFDIQGKMLVNPQNIGLNGAGFVDPLDFLLTVGPGSIQHTDSTAILPGEEGIVYRRPDTGIEAKTKLLGLKVKGGYYAPDQLSSGKINTSRLSGGLGYVFPNTPIAKDLELSAGGDYYVSSPVSTGSKDLRGNLDLSLPFSSNAKLETHFGFAHSNSSGMMVGARLNLDDLFRTGTKVSFSGSKVGSRYISLPSQFDYAGLDYFDRPLENSTVNLGGELVQSLTDKWVLKGKGDVRLSSDFGYGRNKSKSRATAQVGLAYDIAPQTIFDAYYRLNQDPTVAKTSDITAVGLLYKF